MSDWWSKRLGGAPPPAPSLPPQGPSRTLFARNAPPPAAPQAPVYEPEEAAEGDILGAHPTKDDATHPAEFGAKLIAAAGRWRGSVGNKAERERCPQCDSGNFYQRKHGRRGPPPAPECFECGYNGLFSQTGNSDTYDHVVS